MRSRVIAVAVAVALVMAGCGRGPTELDAGGGRRIAVYRKVLGSDPLDIRQYVYSVAAFDATGPIGPVEIHVSLKSPEFRLAKSPDGQLVGLVESRTGSVAAIHDFGRRVWHIAQGWDGSGGYDVAGTLLVMKLVDGAPPQARAVETFRKVLNAGNGREVAIVGVGRAGEKQTRVQWYEAREAGANVIPESQLAPLSDTAYESGYSLVSAEDGALVAVVGEKYAEHVYAMHDFSSGLSWPAGGGDEKAAEERRARLMGRIGREHPSLRELPPQNTAPESERD